MVTRLYTLPFCLPPLCSLFSVLSPLSSSFSEAPKPDFSFFSCFSFRNNQASFFRNSRASPWPPGLTEILAPLPRSSPHAYFPASCFSLLVFCFSFSASFSVLFCSVGSLVCIFLSARSPLSITGISNKEGLL